MYLSKIEIAGFKSFALKTSLNLTEGLIAVVGPNGCGKTNIVDAVRWALGEQKTSVLRSDSMENVIFNGSKMRKPLGMAEVSLTIQNNKHILPLEYNEVTITRRLFRNGESQYLLNKTQCRLRDIVDLFMDTGMGANAYSVIELKMVEQILSDRANDRRTLFEEAAGITKYKSRRKEALRKLDAVQQDLSRVNDIVVEVQKVVASLGRQADKARLYNEVSQKLQIVDLGLLRYDYAQASSGIESIRKEFSEYSAQRDELHKQLEQAEQTLAELEGEQETANYELLQITEQESGYARTQAQLQQNLAVAQERQSSLIRSQERLSREQEESQRSHSTLVDALSRTSERFEIVKQSLSEAEESFTVKRSERDTHFTAVQQLRNDVRAADHEREQATRRYSDQKVRQERTAERIAGLQRRITELSHESRQTEQSLEQISQQLHSQEERLSGYEAAVKEAEQSRTQAQHTQQELRHRIEEKNTLLADKRNALTHKKATLDFLTGLVDTSESSRFLMSTCDWKPTAEKAVLAELIGADDDVRIALEAALGEYGRCFVVNTRQEAEQAIQLLGAKEKGKAQFLCRDLIRDIPAPAALHNNDDIVGWASEIVRTDDELRKGLRALFGKTAIVRTADIAYSLVQSGTADVAITVRGEVYHAAGTVRGGSVAKTEGMAVGKKEQIHNLSAAIEELNNESAALQKELTDIRADLQRIDIRVYDDAVRKASNEKNSFEQSLVSLRMRKEGLESARQKQYSVAEGLEKEIEQQQIEIQTAEKHCEQALVEIEQTSQIKNTLSDTLRGHEAELAVAEQKVREAELRAVQLRAEEKSLLADLQRLDAQIRAAERRTGSRDEESGQTTVALSDLEREIRTLQTELDAITTQKNAIQQQREIIAQKVAELRTSFHSYGDETRSLRNNYERTTENMHKKELQLHDLTVRVEGVIKRADEDFKISVEELQQPLDEEFNVEQAKSDADKYRSRLKSYGNVNFLALEEYEKENARLEFLQTQYNDLIASENTLKETIDEINTTAKEQFNATFDQVRGHFKTLFALLFNEQGEADIVLEEGDPLEAPLTITAKPPGKRPQHIELLSAGEKTLTAIALLFAIYLVKPSPFCILDEVDAPLDDANIERYLQLIRKFSENTQFLVVTHNKKTMEAADVLFGVTQEEEGVSRVVSARFADAPTEASVLQ